ncbi:MAG: UDP-2,3-diacylglucosamine diphosphatase, partial [Bdellovibrionales bacterium]
MVQALFVSDIHIRSPQDPKCALFLRLLERCRELPGLPQLFLVGDIFDLWIADRHHFVQCYQPVIDRVHALRQGGARVHYFEGNHDLDLRVFWQEQLGVDVYESAAYFEIAGKTVRVEHGDQMDPEDSGYLFLRWLLRTRPMRAAGRRLPNRVVRWMGERASRASRDYTSTVKAIPDAVVLEKIRRHARGAHVLRPFEVFVSGHVHIEEDSWQQAGESCFHCFNLGTWLKHPRVLVMDEQGE